jgi:hypothetical protein
MMATDVKCAAGVHTRRGNVVATNALFVEQQIFVAHSERLGIRKAVDVEEGHWKNEKTSSDASLSPCF